jgi:hypothetical protein
MLKKLIRKIDNFLHKNEVTINLHGFNYVGENTETMFSLVDELFKDYPQYRKGSQKYKGYLKFPSSEFVSLISLHDEIINGINKATKDNNKDLMKILENGKDKKLVVSLKNKGEDSLHSNILILKYNGNNWERESYRN